MERRHPDTHKGSPSHELRPANEIGSGLAESIDPEYTLAGIQQDFQRWPEIGYPPIAGAESREEEEGKVYVEGVGWVPQFGDRELFEQSPEEWFRRRNPEWGDDEVKKAVEAVERAKMVEVYEELKGVFEKRDE